MIDLIFGSPMYGIAYLLVAFLFVMGVTDLR